MYTIIHVNDSWVVCDGQMQLVRFNQKSIAVRTAHNAEELLRTNEAEHKTEKPIWARKLALTSLSGSN
jgi:hypothetical protein